MSTHHHGCRKTLFGADVHDFRRGRPWPEGFLNSFVRAGFKGAREQKGLYSACQYIVSLRPWAGNRTLTQMLYPSPCQSTTKLSTTINCQYSVGAYGRCNIALSSQSPGKCRYPLVCLTLFKPAQCAQQKFGLMESWFGLRSVLVKLNHQREDLQMLIPTSQTDLLVSDEWEPHFCWIKLASKVCYWDSEFQIQVQHTCLQPAPVFLQN